MSSPLTRAEVQRIAQLAHLDLTDEEQELFTRQLGQILEYAECLNDVDVDAAKVSASWHPISEPGPLRPDTSQTSLTNDDALRNAPAAGPLGLFRVPRVIG